jgi:hypothetical protein
MCRRGKRGLAHTSPSDTWHKRQPPNTTTKRYTGSHPWSYHCRSSTREVQSWVMMAGGNKLVREESWRDVDSGVQQHHLGLRVHFWVMSSITLIKFSFLEKDRIKEIIIVIASYVWKKNEQRKQQPWLMGAGRVSTRKRVRMGWVGKTTKPF